MTDEPSDLPPTPPPPAPAPAKFWHWIVDGLRASVLLAPRITASPTPSQLLLIVLIPMLLMLGVERLQIDGPATFNPAVELNGFWSIALTLWVGWLALSPAASVSRWFALSTWAAVPWSLLMGAVLIAYFRGWLPKPLTTANGFWMLYGGLIACWFASTVRLMARCAPSRMRLALFVPGMLAITAIGIWQSLQDGDRVWQRDHSASTSAERPRLRLTQETFEAQQAVWQRAVAGIAARPEGESHVYGLVFAPYGSEDVFLRESAMVTRVLEDRFDAKGRVLTLANHATTAEELPWATPLNLRRAVEALGARMDRERDVLVVYMTSHGARDFKLAAANWPLSVQGLTPKDLRESLDAAGIRHRVIAISACYSGGWIEPLADDDSLVMTAADADHTSYGCGSRSELTFFGRAMFDEELRRNHSFEAAFAAAVPVIRQREIDAGKEDGFSNPQIKVGARIRPVLERLTQRLDSN